MAMRSFAVAMVALGALTCTRPADAAWSTTGAGSVPAKATTIQPASSLTGTCSLLTGKVTLGWMATPTPWADGYSVEWGTASHVYTTVAVTTGLTFTTPALGLGTFYFAVRATKGAWRSTYTNEISKTFLLVQCL